MDAVFFLFRVLAFIQRHGFVINNPISISSAMYGDTCERDFLFPASIFSTTDGGWGMVAYSVSEFAITNRRRTQHKRTSLHSSIERTIPSVQFHKGKTKIIKQKNIHSILIHFQYPLPARYEYDVCMIHLYLSIQPQPKV